MPATLHIYTKNFLLAAAEFGISSGLRVPSTNQNAFYNSRNRLQAVFCSTGSSLFDANFDGSLEDLKALGAVEVYRSAFENTYTYYVYEPGNPYNFVTSPTYGLSGTISYKVGSLLQYTYQGPRCYVPARSVLVCMDTSFSANSSLQPMFMIDFGQVVTPASPSGYFLLNWGGAPNAPNVLEMQLA